MSQAQVGAVHRAGLRCARHAGQIWPSALLLLLGAAVLYAPTLRYPFVNWDDPLHVYRNPAITRPEALTFTQRWLPRGLGYPMPVTLFSYRIDAAMHLRPGQPIRPVDGRGFHWTNVALLLLLVALVFRLMRALLRSRWIALLASAAFVCHPLLVEPVAWVSGRKDLLAVALGLAALLSWLRWLRRPTNSTAFAFAALGLLALLAKPLAVFVAPVATYLLLCYSPSATLPHAIDRAHLAARRRLSDYPTAGLVSLALLAACSALLILIARDWNTAVGGVQAELTGAQTIRRALWGLGFHLRLAVAPTVLRAKYVVGPTQWGAYELTGVLITAALLAGLIWRKRDAGPIGVGLALFLASYLPVSSLIPLRRYIADTYMLLPLLGLLLVLAGISELTLWSRRWTVKLPLLVATLACIAMLATVSAIQLSFWRDSVVLWRRAMIFHPNNPKICRMLGHAYNERGEHALAILSYRRCVARHGLEPFANNLAISYYLQGNDDEARRLFRWILQRNRNDPRARRYLQLLGPAGSSTEVETKASP